MTDSQEFTPPSYAVTENKNQTPVLLPHVATDGHLFHRAFIEIKDLPVKYGENIFRFDTLITEPFLQPAHVLNLDAMTVKLDVVQRRVISQLDRLIMYNPEVLPTLIDLENQARTTSKRGKVIYSDGNRYTSGDEQDFKWGISISRLAVKKDGTYLYSEEEKQKLDENAEGFIDAAQLIQEVEEHPDTGYILIFACNGAEQKIDPEKVKVPVIYYTTVSSVRDKSEVVIFHPNGQVSL